MTNFFISYNRADRSWAEWIAWHLEEAGYTTVLQAWDFRAGSNFVQEMQKAVSDAERTIAVFSPDYLTSSFTQTEWQTAFARDPTGEEGLLVPVRVRKCNPKGLLRQIIYVDLLGLEETAAKDALLAGVGRHRGPRTKPDFPPSRTATQKPRFPGTLPSVWNIPYNRNPSFTGRDQLLDDLRTALTSGQPAALTQVVTGLGGVGKTQTAVEYAYRFAMEYEIVWWIRAEEPTKLALDYAALASELKLAEKDAAEQLDPEARASAIIKAVRRWLDQHGGWLLIFDNAKGPTDLRTYLPRGATGHVIVTSRNPNWQGMSALPVEPMERIESVNFLLKRTRSVNDPAISSLAEALGDLPLALEQAGAYIEETQCSIAAYLALFRENSQRLLGRPARDYQETVATTWNVSFEQVQRESPEAENLLSLCAFLAPDEIPLQVLIISKGIKHLPASLAKAIKDPLVFNEVVASLLRYSLVKVSGDRLLSVHRLVQAVGRARLRDADMRTWARIAVLLLSEAFQFDSVDDGTWPACSTLLPHALAATEHAQVLRVAYAATGRLLTAVGKYSVGRAEFAKVKAAFEQALQIDDDFHGPNHPTVAKDATNLGFLLKNQGELPGAKAYFERALKINLKRYGGGDPKVALSLNNLGIILKDLGCLEQAQREFERALKINEESYGPEHPEVAANLNNLGYLLKDQGDMDGALAYFERALKINEAARRVDPHSVVANLNNIGIIRKDKGDTDGAQEYFERALRISEASYDPNHPEIATNLNNLGYLMKNKGDIESARSYFKRALAVYEAAYGRNHPNVVRTRKNISSLNKQASSSKPRRRTPKPP